MNKQAYEEAFRSCYPQVSMITKIGTQRLHNDARVPVLRVFINGTDDGRPLQSHEVDEAIGAFNRSRRP